MALLNSTAAAQALRQVERVNIVEKAGKPAVVTLAPASLAAELARAEADHKEAYRAYRASEEYFAAETGPLFERVKAANERRKAAKAKLEGASPAPFRKLSCTDLREGLEVVARGKIKRFGSFRREGEVAAGSRGTVLKVSPEFTATVEFRDAETGEVIVGECDSYEIGLPVEVAA